MTLSKIALCCVLLFTTLAGSFATAAERDGLDPAMRRVFYSSKTLAVVRIDIAALGEQPIAAAFRGLFYDSTWAKLDKQVTMLESGRDAALTELRLLGLQGFTHVTVVAVDNGGLPTMYQIVELGPKLMDDENFQIWKFGLTGLAKGTMLDKVGRFAVFHPAGTTIPTESGEHGTIEPIVQLGLQQAPVNAAVNCVLLPGKQVRELVDALTGSNPRFADLNGRASDATYCGGFVVTGSQPRLSMYVRFGSEEKAAAMKQLYDAAWQKEIAEAAVSDQRVLADIARLRSKGVDTTAMENDFAKYATQEETMRRIFDATATKAFGRVFLLDMGAGQLREVTAAIAARAIGK